MCVYFFFYQRLGTLINLQETDPQATFLGGLDRAGRDGKFAYFWQDDITQVSHARSLIGVIIELSLDVCSWETRV